LLNKSANRSNFFRAGAATSCFNRGAPKKPAGIGNVHLSTSGKIGSCRRVRPSTWFGTVAERRSWGGLPKASRCLGAGKSSSCFSTAGSRTIDPPLASTLGTGLIFLHALARRDWRTRASPYARQHDYELKLQPKLPRNPTAHAHRFTLEKERNIANETTNQCAGKRLGLGSPAPG